MFPHMARIARFASFSRRESGVFYGLEPTLAVARCALPVAGRTSKKGHFAFQQALLYLLAEGMSARKNRRPTL